MKNFGSTAPKTIALVFGLTLMGLSLGCAQAAPEPTPTPTATQTPTPEPTPTPTPEPEPEPPVVWPLTGAGTDALLERPAVAVKIENSAAARPQTGLNQADVVWETIIDFDVSRLLAVYHSVYPEAVGPVRSIRPVDMRVYAPLDPVFVFSGAQKGILAQMKATQGFWLDETRGQAGMWRDRSRVAPHNLYGSVEKLSTLATNHTNSPEEQFSFAPDFKEASAAVAGETTSNISLNMSTAAKPQWQWSENAKVWVRSEGNTPVKDSQGEPLTATNVVIIEVKAVNSAFKAQNNAPVPDNLLEGTGTATVATGGKTLTGTWSKADKNSPLVLHTEDGKSLDLAPGNTWVELLPQPRGSYILTP